MLFLNDEQELKLEFISAVGDSLTTKKLSIQPRISNDITRM